MQSASNFDGVASKESTIIGMHPHELSAPIHVVLEITGRCNFRCIHCAVDANNSSKAPGREEPELSFREITDLIDRLQQLGVAKILISGGEPLLREDALEIMAHIKERQIDCCLLTNGVLIDESMSAKLKALDLTVIEMNLNGVDAEFNDYFFGSAGSFEAIVRSLKLLVAARIPVRVNIMCAKNVMPHCRGTIDLLVSLGVKEICLGTQRGSGRALRHEAELFFTPNEHAELLVELESINAEMKSKHGDNINLVYNGNEAVLEYLSPAGMLAQCGAGRLHCTISPTGDVRPCPYFPMDEMSNAGNIRTSDIKNIWDSADIFQQMRDKNIAGCERCNEKSCVGGCRLEALRRSGRITSGPDPYCKKATMARIKALI